jgi:CheY-like chemotaxis protein
VIALTGHALTGHAEGAHAAGADAFVTKPCVPSDLAAQIRRILDPQRR